MEKVIRVEDDKTSELNSLLKEGYQVKTIGVPVCLNTGLGHTYCYFVLDKVAENPKENKCCYKAGDFVSFLDKRNLLSFGYISEIVYDEDVTEESTIMVAGEGISLRDVQKIEIPFGSDNLHSEGDWNSFIPAVGDVVRVFSDGSISKIEHVISTDPAIKEMYEIGGKNLFREEFWILSLSENCKEKRSLWKYI